MDTLPVVTELKLASSTVATVTLSPEPCNAIFLPALKLTVRLGAFTSFTFLPST